MPFTFKAILNDKPKQDGTHLVLIRITKDRRIAKLSMGIFVKKSEWNPIAKNDNYVRPSCPQHTKYNTRIANKLKEARELADDSLSLTDLQNLLKGIQPTKASESFLEFFEQHIARMKPSVKSRTVEKYQNALNKIKRFAKDNDVLFSGLTVAFVRDFESYLLTHNKPNTIQKTMQFVNVVVKRAIEVDKIDPSKNPFLRVKFKREKTDKARLTEAEMKRLENLVLPTDRQIFHARNIFLMQYYCSGVRIGDMLQVKWKSIVNGRLVYRTDKNERALSIKLQAGALRILDNYIAQDRNHYIFPFLSNQADYSDPAYLVSQMESKTTIINKHLRRLRVLAEIDKHITTHVSRHSFADMARKKTGDIYAISKALGHSSIKITEVYLSSFDEQAVDDTMDSIFKE